MATSDPLDLVANAQRFSGFADLYDRVRPAPPPILASILTAYSGGTRPRLLVDLGSGTGLSSRWASTWVDEVVGVEPSDDMRRQASAATAAANVRYETGWSHATGLPDNCADVVVAAQALHWMDPTPTFAEVGRLLRPGGVFAAIDCDWPPSIGNAPAEGAWRRCRAIVKSYEERLAAGLTGEQLRAPLGDDADVALPAHFGRDPNKGRTMAVGVQSWSKDEHLSRMLSSGAFAWCGEVAVLGEEASTAERFIDLLRSQGDLQTLVKHGVDEGRLGVDKFAAATRAALGTEERPMWFTFRVRIGVTPND